MLSEAQPCVSAKEVLARQMTWTTAERTRRGSLGAMEEEKKAINFSNL